MQVYKGEQQRVFRARVDGSGRVVLPKEVRERMQLESGDGIILIDNGTSCRIETPEQSLREAQAYFTSLVEPGVGVVDELLSERRDEAAHE